MKNHHLKSISKHFNQLGENKRNAEVRYCDRNYQIGDGITFHECHNGMFLGNTKTARIKYLDDFGCQYGYINISLGDFGCLIVE